MSLHNNEGVVIIFHEHNIGLCIKLESRDYSFKKLNMFLKCTFPRYVEQHEEPLAGSEFSMGTSTGWLL